MPRMESAGCAVGCNGDSEAGKSEQWIEWTACEGPPWSLSPPAVPVLKAIHGKRLATVFIGKNILAGRFCSRVNPKWA